MINRDARMAVRAKFWRLFRKPVDLDAYVEQHGQWPRHLVEGDYYTSLFGQRFAITKGIWRPVSPKETRKP